ncbi:MAG: cysteine desulfurase NifS [Tissierellia bacterium]|nr:cysteine desulfurase NifS [Tissierellia bacterium]
MEKLIYMDNAATTQVSDKVLDTMVPYFRESYGNPSSIYGFGQKNKAALQEAREKVAKSLNADPKEIYFTGSGTEADNWAIREYAKKHQNKGKHIITTAIEHHAVLHVCQDLEKEGFDVTYLGVDEEGIINLEELKAAIRPDTILISIMYANNEIGSIQPIKDIGALAKEKGLVFHTDAVQAAGILDIDVKEENIDMLSLSAHKFHGPKGVGVLYVRRGVNLPAFILGGAQENNKRASTENVPGIVGLGAAIEEAQAHKQEDRQKLSQLRDYLIDQVLEKIPHTRLNGPRGDKRLPGNANFSFEFIEGESLLLMLDHFGIAGSSGSACTSGSLDPSHVLLAIGLPHEIAHGSLRLSLGPDTSKEDIDYVVEKLEAVVKRLRDMSPLYADFLEKGGNK